MYTISFPSYTSPACRATTTPRQSIPLPPRQAKIPLPRPDPASLRSTWEQRAWVVVGSATLISSLATAVSLSVQCHTPPLEPFLAAFAGYSLADLLTGIYHWGVDNYGDETTPFFGSQIAGFQGHHRYPYTITRREFCNNLHALARAATFAVLPFDFAAGMSVASHAFVCSLAGCIVLSQQFHAWAHEKKGRLPAAVYAMQRAGLLISRAEHMAHHRAPYNTNYCIVNGMWNGVLARFKVFEAMEMVFFFRFGVRPRSWVEPAVDWMEAEDEGGGEEEDDGEEEGGAAANALGPILRPSQVRPITD